MFYQRKIIDVRISRRVLWVGAEAYPLHNIARAQTAKLVLKRGAALWAWLKAIVVGAFLGVVGVVALSFTGLLDSDAGWLLVMAVMLVAALIRTLMLISALRTPTLYALVIETAGAPSTALVSVDPRNVTQLVHSIMDAIDNPHAEFQMQVENVHVGDKIQQFGVHNLGKVTR